MSIEGLQTSDLVSVYRRIREVIETKEEAHKAEISDLKSQLDMVGNRLLEICNEQDADSIKTSAGTITRTVTSRYWTTDWDSFYKVVKEHDVPQLLQQRIHDGNLKQFLEENPEAFPPGLQCDRKYVLRVRKPTNK